MNDSPDYIDLSAEKHSGRAIKPGSWASMNKIQRGGVIGFFPLYMLSLVCDGRYGIGFGITAWSWIFLGYVAGNLWKYRHAVHFWWSVAFAFIVHCSLIPVYVGLIPLMKSSGHSGRSYAQLTFALVVAEILVLLFALKRFAMWLHKRIHSSSSSVRISDGAE
jgi:hypothetical protein